MKDLFLVCSVVLIGMFLFVQPVISQNQQEAQPIDHQKKVYKDVESNKLYWPVDLPFYVRLAVSPDESAPSFLLDEKVVETSSNKTEIVEEGIRLEISGNQFIRWINSVTSQETRLKFFADGNPPEIADSLFGAPVFEGNSDLFYGKNLMLKLKANDVLSGVNDIYYSIDGKPFQQYSDIINLDTEKSFNIRYYALDNVGYFNNPNRLVFTVDHTSPTTQKTIETNYIDNILSKSTTILLSSEDNLSGVNNIQYAFDENDYTAYRKPIALQNLSNGEHKITFFSTDEVENTEKETVYDFYLDKQPPDPVLSIEGKKHVTENRFYVSVHSRVKLAAEDDKAGVDKILYKINDARDYIEYENQFPLSLKAGEFSITYYALDKLNNACKPRMEDFFMDIVPPQTKHVISGPHSAQRSTVWINRDTRIKLASEDDASGLDYITYVLGENTPDTFNINNPVRISNDGNFLFRYWGTDLVGNREGDNVLLLIADNTPPDIKEIFSVSPNDTIQSADGQMLSVYPIYTTLFLAATDMSSGLKGVWYSLNGGAEQEYFNSILCDEPGDYKIVIRAEDNLGHTATKEISFHVKKLSPEY